MAEDKIAALFGNGKLSYDELLIKAGESGIEVGDVLEVKGEYGSRLHSERVKHAKNTDLVGKMIDLSLVTSDEDGVYGLDEQIENLEKTAPYLFGEEEKEKPKLFSTGMTHGEAKSDPDKLDDYEYYKKIKKI